MRDQYTIIPVARAVLPTKCSPDLGRQAGVCTVRSTSSTNSIKAMSFSSNNNISFLDIKQLTNNTLFGFSKSSFRVNKRFMYNNLFYFHSFLQISLNSTIIISNYNLLILSFLLSSKEIDKYPNCRDWNFFYGWIFHFVCNAVCCSQNMLVMENSEENISSLNN